MPSNVTCSVLGCKPARTGSVFRSPHPGQQWDLFVAWLKTTGNPKYLHVNPQEDYKKINICEAHFTQEEVVHLKRKRKFCIPTLNLPAPLKVQFGIDYHAPHASEEANKENVVELQCKRRLSSPTPEAGPSIRQLMDNVVSQSKHSEIVELSTSLMINTDSVSSPRSSNKSAGGREFHTIISKTKLNNLSSNSLALYTEAKKLQQKRRRLQVSTASIKRHLLEATKVMRSQNVGERTGNLTEMRNAHKKPQGRTYTFEEKMGSLIRWKSSPSVYDKLNRLGFDLPPAATLRKLFSKIPLKPCISNVVLDSIENISIKMGAKEKHCILIFDEVDGKPHLDYSSYADEIVGFQSTSKNIADHATVFMLRGVFKKWKQPVAYTGRVSS